jgi:phosphate:Na+ symporter
MILDIFVALGGLGLFLVGMIVLTEGLRSLVGGSMRRVLARFTRTPASGALFGALTTAVVQSSSATAVTAIGFVGAGLLTFTQALGILFGANVGTTVTGWLVALVGFKLDFGTFVLPVILAGALLRMFGVGRFRHVGWALVGFGVLFVGLDAMKQGMAPFQGLVTPDDFPGDTFFGWLQLALIGVAITLVTQSSSAGVAAALVAIGAGAISLPQACAMVIGMNVGTTFTAVLATIGGSTATRRTGYANVLFNLFAAVVALALLGPYTRAVAPLLEAGGGDAQVALVAFHTVFNLVGVVLILPFTSPFARLVAWLVPERGPPLLRHLEDSLLNDPASAADAAAATIRDLAMAATGIVADLLADRGRGFDTARLDALDEALQVTRSFIDRIPAVALQSPSHQRRIAAMHGLDHLRRLAHRCRQSERVGRLGSDHRLRRLARLLRAALSRISEDDLAVSRARMDRIRGIMRGQREDYRAHIIALSVREAASADDVLHRMDSVRWLHRVAYHVWRILYHLERARSQSPPPAAEIETALDMADD